MRGVWAKVRSFELDRGGGGYSGFVRDTPGCSEAFVRNVGGKVKRCRV